MPYLQPVIRCKNRERVRKPTDCAPIVLPWPILPETGTPRPHWPEDGWKANIACPQCGLLFVYMERHDSPCVLWEQASYRGQGQFHSNAVCVRVEFRCSQTGCETPITFHTTTADRNQGSFGKLREILRSGFFQGRCAKEHALLPVPKEKYRIEEVFDPIPSDPSLVYFDNPPNSFQVRRGAPIR